MVSPAISIVMPVYKAEHYLNRSLNSILAQTFSDWEAILVDDGSPDGSGIILDEYAKKDSRFRVIHKKNGGVSSARQTGIDNAIGEFIIHIDPDDWVEPNMLDGLYNKIIEDNADMVICDYFEEKRKRTRVSSQRPSALDTKSILLDLFSGQLHGSCWNKLVRKDVITANNISFPIELSLHEDLYFIVSLLLKDIKVSYLNKAFYHYVIDENVNSIAHKLGQSYEYDIMVLKLFDNLLTGYECKIYAYRLFASKVILKEFLRGKSTNIEYIKNCMPYIDAIPYVNPKRIRFLCALSLVGCYRLIKFLYDMKSH